MEHQKAFGNIKQQMTRIMGQAAELHDRLPENEKAVMGILREQLTAAYRSLLISEGILFPASALPAKQKPPRRAFGQYGWVKLTEPQHAALAKKYGAEILERAIEYVDESAQKTGNRNDWKDWSLVLHNAIRDDWGKCRSGAAEAARKKQAEARDLMIIDAFMKDATA